MSIQEDCIYSNCIKEYESFIDEQVEKLKYEKLKDQLYNDLLDKITTKMRDELNSTYNVRDRRHKKIERELNEKNEMIAHLEQEVFFLREENAQKNNIILNLAAKSPVHVDDDFSSHIVINSNMRDKVSPTRKENNGKSSL